MKLVALLRGINVGGNSIISMAELKATIEQAGMQQVSTYINSGNVIFETSLPAAKAAGIIERAIETTFGFPVMVIVLDAKQIASIAKALPDDWVNNETMKCDVMFLGKTVDTPQIVDQVKIKPDIDHVIYTPGALLWSVAREDVTRSGLLKIIGTDAYRQMTVRNCNTLRKLVKLLS